MAVHHLPSKILAGAALALAVPAFAQTPPPPPSGDAAPPQDGYDVPGALPPEVVAYQQARADWLAECRSRHGNGNMVGGAVVGGVVGGIIGNQVGGHGNRALGTIAGAAIGATAGGAIGAGADRREARDYCASYLERYSAYAPAGYGYAPMGYGWGYPPMMVPMAMAQATPARARECTETVVTEEWVDGPRRRFIPRGTKRVIEKRVRID